MSAFDSASWARARAHDASKSAEHDREVARRAVESGDRATLKAERLREWARWWTDVSPADRATAEDILACPACDGEGRFNDGWCDACEKTGIRTPACDCDAKPEAVWNGEPVCRACVASRMEHGHQHVHDEPEDCVAEAVSIDGLKITYTCKKGWTA